MPAAPQGSTFMGSPLSLLRACIGTMNLIVLLLVLVLDTTPSDRGRERGRGRKGGSWKALFRFSNALGPSTTPTGRARCPDCAATRRAENSPPYLEVHGKP